MSVGNLKKNGKTLTDKCLRIHFHTEKISSKKRKNRHTFKRIHEMFVCAMCMRLFFYAVFSRNTNTSKEKSTNRTHMLNIHTAFAWICIVRYLYGRSIRICRVCERASERRAVTFFTNIFWRIYAFRMSKRVCEQIQSIHSTSYSLTQCMYRRASHNVQLSLARVCFCINANF